MEHKSYKLQRSVKKSPDYSSKLPRLYFILQRAQHRFLMLYAARYEPARFRIGTYALCPNVLCNADSIYRVLLAQEAVN